jgi:hypothetical protein
LLGPCCIIIIQIVPAALSRAQSTQLKHVTPSGRNTGSAGCIAGKWYSSLQGTKLVPKPAVTSHMNRIEELGATSKIEVHRLCKH